MKVKQMLFVVSLLLGSLIVNAGQERATFFLQNAASATMTPVPQHPDTFQLTLQGVSPKVVYLIDRPFRQHGLVKLDDFTALWQGSFKDVPPNVAIETTFRDQSGAMQPLTLVGVFSKPQYNSEKHSITYTVVLQKDQNQVRQVLGETTLFFDDIPFNPGGF